MKIQTRRRNKGEQYACAPKDVKALFSDCGIYVSFGALSREFRFDGRDHNHPRIAGAVVASLGVNRREGMEEWEGILAFYAIRDSSFGPESRKAFVEGCLPQLRARYLETTVENAPMPPGVYETLVEWAGGGFTVYSYRYT